MIRTTLRRAVGRLLVTAAALGMAGCAGTGGGLAPSHELTPHAENALDHAPRIPAVPRELHKTVLPSYTLEPGDTVLVEPIRFDSPLRFPGDQVIQPDGSIDLGKYGRLIVAGQKIEDIEIAIESAVNCDPEIIQSLKDAELTGLERVNVRLIDPRGSLFYVMGAVNNPGAYPLTGRETVLDAIVAAGGLADNAKRCDILLARPSPVGDCRSVLPVCYDNIVQLGDTTTNYQLLPGDRVFVPAGGLCDTICGFFCKPTCTRCCGPQCPCGYATVRCPYPTMYDQSCPPLAGGPPFCNPGDLPAPALPLNGPTPADSADSGPAIDVPPAPDADTDPLDGTLLPQ